jgi:hypothetical protein
MGVARVVKSIQSFIAKSGVVLSFVTKSIINFKEKRVLFLVVVGGGNGVTFIYGEHSEYVGPCMP